MSYEEYICFQEETLEECMRRMAKLPERVMFVVDESRGLRGAISEGDVIRALLMGYENRFAVVENWMTRNCFHLNEETRDSTNPAEVFVRFGHLAYPITNDEGEVLEVLRLRESLRDAK